MERGTSTGSRARLLLRISRSDGQRGAKSETWTMKSAERFLCEHHELTRRYFLRLGVAGTAALGLWPRSAGADPLAPELVKAIETLEPYFTPQQKFREVSRRTPLPQSHSDKNEPQATRSR